MAKKPVLSAKVDDATFQRNLQTYLNETSKSTIDALNLKLYDGAREAFKTTHKADKNDIHKKLSETSTKYPKRTVAQMIVITQKHATGEDVYDLEQEVTKLKGKKVSHIGFIRAGWLPAIRDLLQKVGKLFANFGGVKRMGYGGAHPVKKAMDVYTGDIYNDSHGKGVNGDFVQKIKEAGGENAKNKINADITTYLSKKLGVPAEKFNRSR